MSRPSGIEDENQLQDEDDWIIEDECCRSCSKKCSCCFSLRGVAISTIIFTVSIATLVFLLDITILEASRRNRQRYYAKDDSIIKIEQHGGKLEPPKESLWNVKSIELTNVESSVEVLYDILSSVGSIQTVRLQNITLTGKMHNRQSYPNYYLRYLKEFTLELNLAIGPNATLQLDQCDECKMDGSLDSDGSIRQLPCLIGFIGFIEYVNYEIKQEILISEFSQMNITIIFNGRTLLKIVPTTGEFVSMFEQCDMLLRDILENYKPAFQFRTLALNGCRNLSMNTFRSIIQRGGLTKLILDDVTFKDFNPSSQRLSEIIGEANTLEDCTLKFGRVTDSTNSAQMIHPVSKNISRNELWEITFQDLPSSLKSLRLSQVRVFADSTLTSIGHLNLENLVLHGVHFENPTALNFLFNRLKFRRISVMDLIKEWDSEFHTSVQDWPSFFKKLFQNEITNWILFSNVKDELNLVLMSITELNQISVNAALKHWLNFLEQLSFKYDVTSSAFLVEKNTDGKWIGKKQFNSLNMMKLWYQLLNMNVFLKQELVSLTQW